MALARISLGRRKSLPHHKKKNGRDYEQDKRIAREPISKPFPTRRLEIFLHSHRPDISGTASIEVARTGVMKGMFPSPVVVWRERQETRDESDDVVQAAG